MGGMGLEQVKIGESETEAKLHRIAEEIEPILKHKTYFRTKNRNELITELTEATRMPGVSPIMTQPIRNRVDMLATGIQTPNWNKSGLVKTLRKLKKLPSGLSRNSLSLREHRVPYAERIGNKPYLEFHINREEAARLRHPNQNSTTNHHDSNWWNEFNLYR